MFAQVIQGRTSDAEAVHAAADRWLQDLAPGAVGWLGGTFGVSDDGRFVAVARFESTEAARRNSDRAEQGRWWEETRPLFDGEPTFLESENVFVGQVGDPDRAGFVQVMQGQVTDAPRALEVMARLPLERLAEFRPEILGSVFMTHDDGRWTQAVYFTSEAEARKGEGQDPPAEVREVLEELMSLSTGQPEYIDIRRPVLQSPG